MLATSKVVFSCWMMIALEKPAMWASAAGWCWCLGLGITSHVGFRGTGAAGAQEQQQSSWSQMTQKPVTWETHGFDFALQATSQTRLDAAWARNQPITNQEPKQKGNWTQNVASFIWNSSLGSLPLKVNPSYFSWEIIIIRSLEFQNKFTLESCVSKQNS